MQHETDEGHVSSPDSSWRCRCCCFSRAGRSWWMCRVWRSSDSVLSSFSPSRSSGWTLEKDLRSAAPPGLAVSLIWHTMWLLHFCKLVQLKVEAAQMPSQMNHSLHSESVDSFQVLTISYRRTVTNEESRHDYLLFFWRARRSWKDRCERPSHTVSVFLSLLPI